MGVGNLISGSSAFSKSNGNICKFMVHVLLKPGLENVNAFTARSNQSILREIKPEYSLKGLMLKLKFQYSGHLMQTGLEKVIPIPKKGNAKECSNYRTIILISHASNVMLKILHFNSMRTENFQMFKLDLEKAGEPEIKLPTSVGL